MIDPAHDLQEEFAEAQGHEYQNPHYHDEEPDIVDDEIPHTVSATTNKKKAMRPPPRPRHYED